MIFRFSSLNFSAAIQFPPRTEEHSLPYYLPIAGGRIFGFIPFPRVLKKSQTFKFGNNKLSWIKKLKINRCWIHSRWLKEHITICNILRCIQKHSQHNNDKRTQFFRKIYLSHFIRKVTKGLRKGYCVRGELETEQNCNILTPSSSGYSSTSFSSCGAAQPEALRARQRGWVWFSLLELQQLTPNSDVMHFIASTLRI